MTSPFLARRIAGLARAAPVLFVLLLTLRASAGPGPEALEPFVPFVEQCEKYEKLAVGWEPVFELDLSKAPDAGPAAYELVPEAAAPAPAGGEAKPGFKEALKVAKDDKNPERTVLVLDATTLGPARLAFGPPVSGDFRAEFYAKVVSDKVCDLSLVCDAVGEGPGFQFGTADNKRNVLWPGRPAANANNKNPNAAPPPPLQQGGLVIIVGGQRAVAGGQPGGQAGAVELPRDRLVLRRDWHRVTLEVADGSVSAFVDGRPVGKAPLAPGFDRTAPRRAVLFTNGSKVVVAEMRVEQFRVNLDKPALKEAWPTVFGEMTADQVAGKIEALIAKLNSADAAVRESAEKLLMRVGHLALAPLEKTAERRTLPPEMRRRAEALVKALKEQPAASPRAKG